MSMPHIGRESADPIETKRKKKIKTSSRNIYLRSADNNANDTITTNEHENQT